jgi:hypothetical protein
MVITDRPLSSFAYPEKQILFGQVTLDGRAALEKYGLLSALRYPVSQEPKPLVPDEFFALTRQ